MAFPVSDVEQLERVLLQRGVDDLEAGRERCQDCGRTPLTGEHVHLYGGEHDTPHRLVCELCRLTRREAPVATETVRHCGYGHRVRLTRAA